MHTRNTGQISIACMAALVASAATIHAAVIDRIAVIAGTHVIKLSDIDRDIRLTDFINRQPLDFSAKAKRASADRLVNQVLIRDEIVTANYRRASESQADQVQKQLVHDRFGGSPSQFEKALAGYGLTADQLHEQLQWQLTVLQFINERFRVGVQVTDQQAQEYYNQHQAELKKQNPGANAEALQAASHDALESRAVDKAFEDWLDRARMRTRIEYKEAAFS